jgi:ABC-2 type transport system permease protein
MLQVGPNIASPALFVLGIGALIFGLSPRLVAPLVYGLVAWSFVIEIIGSSIRANHWLLDTAVLSHIPPVPAANLNWTATAWLVGLGIVAAAVGLVAFDRRDLATA